MELSVMQYKMRIGMRYGDYSTHPALVTRSMSNFENQRSQTIEKAQFQKVPVRIAENSKGAVRICTNRKIIPKWVVRIFVRIEK